MEINLMKNCIILLILLLSGCRSTLVYEQLSKNAAKLDGYVRLMNDQKTTTQQDRELIRAMRIWTWELNYYANGEIPPEDIREIISSRLDGKDR